MTTKLSASHNEYVLSSCLREQGDGARLIVLSHAHDGAETALDMVQKLESGLSAFPGAVCEEGVRP